MTRNSAAVEVDFASLEAVFVMDIDVLERFGVSEESIGILKKLECSKVEQLVAVVSNVSIADFVSVEQLAIILQLTDMLRIIHMQLVFFGKRISRDVLLLEAHLASSSPSPSPAPTVSLHGEGHCRPCAWFHHEGGCKHSTTCHFCHECPPGELKRRKKEKKALMQKLSQLPLLSASIDSTNSASSPFTLP